MGGGLGARSHTGRLPRESKADGTGGVGLRAERLRKGLCTPATLRSPLVGQPQSWAGCPVRRGDSHGPRAGSLAAGCLSEASSRPRAPPASGSSPGIWDWPQDLPAALLGGVHRHRECPQRKLRLTPRGRLKRRASVPLPAGLSPGPARTHPPRRRRVCPGSDP